MKTINLYFDFEFTSLSSDAQPISLGIVSDRIGFSEDELYFDLQNGRITMEEYLDSSTKGRSSRSFYAEFTDFDINRCDDWVKEKVIKKLEFYPEIHDGCTDYCMEHWDVCMNVKGVVFKLNKWLEQFNDYQIQFVCDCGTFDWYWMLQLLDLRATRSVLLIDAALIPNDMTGSEFVELVRKEMKKGEGVIVAEVPPEIKELKTFRKGLPELPPNISPVPLDLNDLIAHKKGISVKEAFDLNREELMYLLHTGKADPCALEDFEISACPNKHNALWDAEVIKSVYNRIK